MALTVLSRGLDQIKGPFQGAPGATPYHLFRASFNVSGTYATGGQAFDLGLPFAGVTGATTPTGSRMGVTALSVNWVKAFGDYFDGTNTLTVNDASAALTSGGTTTPISAASTNNIATLKLFTGANGAGGSELTNATALSGDFSVVFAAQLTYGSLGTA